MLWIYGGCCVQAGWEGIAVTSSMCTPRVCIFIVGWMRPWQCMLLLGMLLGMLLGIVRAPQQVHSGRRVR